MRIRHLLTAAALATAALLPAGPAAASCLFDDRPLEAKVQEAPTVFVGEVVATRHGDTTAQVRLSEIWKGAAPNLRQVTVQGGSGQDGAATSVDRFFAVGATYLFLVQPEGSVFTDNACSATQEWTPELAGARPESAMTIDAQDAGPDGDAGRDGDDDAVAIGALPLALAALGLLGALAAGGTVWAARNRSSNVG